MVTATPCLLYDQKRIKIVVDYLSPFVESFVGGYILETYVVCGVCGLGTNAVIKHGATLTKAKDYLLHNLVATAMDASKGTLRSVRVPLSN